MQKFYFLIISLLALNAYTSEIKHSFIAAGLSSLDIGYDFKISASHVSFLTSTSTDFSKDHYSTPTEWSSKRKHITWNLTALYGKDFPITYGLSLRPAIGLVYILNHYHNDESFSNPDHAGTHFSNTMSDYLFLARLSFLKQFEHFFAGTYSDIASIDISDQVLKTTEGRVNGTDCRINLGLMPKFLFGYMF